MGIGELLTTAVHEWIIPDLKRQYVKLRVCIQNQSALFQARQSIQSYMRYWREHGHRSLQ